MEPAARRASAAHNLAKDVLGCDEGVLGVMVIDEKGRVLARLVEDDSAFPSTSLDVLSALAAVDAVIMGAVQDEKTIKAHGALQFVVLTFSQRKVLLVRLPSHGLTVSCALRRSSLAEHVYYKIVEMFRADEDRVR